MCWYMLHLVSLRDTDMSPVPSSMQFWNTTAKLHKSCRGANFRDVFLCPVPLIPVLLSFLPLSPLGTFLFGQRWTLQDGQGISKGTVGRPMSRYMLHLIAFRDTDLYLCPAFAKSIGRNVQKSGIIAKFARQTNKRNKLRNRHRQYLYSNHIAASDYHCGVPE